MTTQRINWEEVRTRLRASESALEEALVQNPARVQAVFRKRAAHLAKGNAVTIAKTPAIPALIFTLQTERYAIRLHELAEVINFKDCTPVPGTGPEFLGVINRHGELLPVMDLGRLIAPESETMAAGFILMLRRPGQQIGLRVDQVERLQEIPGDRLEGAKQGRYTTRVSGETLLLLDVERVLGPLK